MLRPLPTYLRPNEHAMERAVLRICADGYGGGTALVLVRCSGDVQPASPCSPLRSLIIAPVLLTRFGCSGLCILVSFVAWQVPAPGVLS
jgi:hypothetical protein